MRHRLFLLAIGFSGLLWTIATLSYAVRPDAMALLTMAPAWLWLLLGLLFAGVRIRRRLVALLWLLWAGFALPFVDELRPVFHPVSWFHRPQLSPKSPEVFRVVSLNCAGGDPQAAQEVIAWQPDLVLLQEAPTERHVHALAERLYGNPNACAIGLDTAILGRGLSPLAPPAELRRCAFARVPLGSWQLFVSSIRLMPSSLDLDFGMQTMSRKNRRAELEEILRFVPTNEPLLLGGDMNVPAGDGALSPLKDRQLSDTFALAGVGWGNTVENGLPIHRIDQLYSNARGLSPMAIIAVPTAHSDHRMLVADFRLL
ncbi:MAG: hypothetical protein QM758_07145 [Armatimonas sp.]